MERDNKRRKILRKASETERKCREVKREGGLEEKKDIKRRKAGWIALREYTKNKIIKRESKTKEGRYQEKQVILRENTKIRKKERKKTDVKKSRWS